MGTVSDVFISRDKVIEAIEREFGDEARPECISAKEAVYSVELADVAPVVHGHWKYNKKSWWVPECSVCEARPFKGYIPSMDEVKKTYKYCPNCGAKMDESEGEQ